MLRIYTVMLEMCGAAAKVAAQIELHDKGLAHQLREAAQSVALNTAEGMGSIGGHKRQRYQTALGSAIEAKACPDVAMRMGYIHEIDATFAETIDHSIATLVRLVHGRPRRGR